MVAAKVSTITCPEGHARPAAHAAYPCPWYACRSVYSGDSTRSPQVACVPVGASDTWHPNEGSHVRHVIEREPNEPGQAEYRWVNIRAIGRPYHSR